MSDNNSNTPGSAADGQPSTGTPEPPSRPDGVSEADWDALGDPGKQAIVRERQRAQAAEAALAAERAKAAPKPGPPKKDDQPPVEPSGKQPAADDLAAIVARAVSDAFAPFAQREAEREASTAAEKVVSAVTEAASARFHDPSDAVGSLDLTALTDGSGRPDAAKVNAALDDLLTRKPHLGKPVDSRRHAAPGTSVGNGAAPAQSLEDRVKEQLALMNRGS